MTDPRTNYAAESATGLSPLGLVVRLYETVISDLGRAITAVRDGNVECRTFELQHALAIIGHLQGALDMDHGGEPAALLDRFYTLARKQILGAQVQQSAKSLEELIRDLINLREAWAEVEKSQASSTPPPNEPNHSGQWVA